MSATNSGPSTAGPEATEFWVELNRHQFVLLRCQACGAWRWPWAGCREHPNEPYLTNMKWTPASGYGNVFSLSIPQLQFREDFPTPYVYALIELDEGPIMPSNIVDAEPNAVAIGTRVEVVFDDLGDSLTVPRFRPTAASMWKSEGG